MFVPQPDTRYDLKFDGISCEETLDCLRQELDIGRVLSRCQRLDGHDNTGLLQAPWRGEARH